MFDLSSIGDLSDVSAQRPAIPAATYNLTFTGSEIIESKTGEPLLQLTYRVASGDYEGYEFSDVLSLNPTKAPGKKASGFDVAKSVLKGLVSAFTPDPDEQNTFFRGATTPQDIASILNARLRDAGVFTAEVEKEAGRLRNENDPEGGRWPARNRISASGFVPAKGAA